MASASVADAVDGRPGIKYVKNFLVSLCLVI